MAVTFALYVMRSFTEQAIGGQSRIFVKLLKTLQNLLIYLRLSIVLKETKHGL